MSSPPTWQTGVIEATSPAVIRVEGGYRHEEHHGVDRLCTRERSSSSREVPGGHRHSDRLRFRSSIS